MSPALSPGEAQRDSLPHCATLKADATDGRNPGDRRDVRKAGLPLQAPLSPPSDSWRRGHVPQSRSSLFMGLIISNPTSHADIGGIAAAIKDVPLAGAGWGGGVSADLAVSSFCLEGDGCLAGRRLREGNHFLTAR